MQYAENFELPEKHTIITTRDHPFCPDFEPCFHEVVSRDLLRAHNNVDVAVICRDLDSYKPYITIVRARQVLFNLIAPAIWPHQWQNGLITDPGLLHGGAVHRVYDVQQHRTVAVLGSYIGKRTAGDLITDEGIEAQIEKIGARVGNDIARCDQHTWHRQFHVFRRSVQRTMD